MATQLYSMKWENYYSHVSDLFHQLLDTGSMSDVVLYAEGAKINCHKVLLSACSPYFQEILSDVGLNNTAIIISGIDGEDVKTCIEFIYRGEVSIKADRLCSVLKAADTLKICGLMEVSCEMENAKETETAFGSVLNNQSENDNSNKLVFKRSPPQTRKPDDKIDNPVADCKNEEVNHKDDSGIIVYPHNMLRITDSEGNRENCEIINGTGNLNRKNKIQIYNDNEDTDSNHLTIKMDLDEIQEQRTKDCQNEMKIDNNLMIDEMRLFKRKDNRKKLYSEEAMLAALEDMKSGKNLVKSAEKHRVPRTTLYCRAKAIGACSKVQRKGYPREKMMGAVQAVGSGCSLQYASNQYGIPKTVLWRRVKKEFGNRFFISKHIKGPTCSPQINSTAEDNVSIRRVSPQYQIPKATLFRWEKVCSVNDKDKYEEPQLHFISGNEGINVDTINNGRNSKEAKASLLSTESENNDGIIEVASPNNVNQDNNELQVNYLENPEFSSSSIIILAPVEQHTGENKFTDLKESISAQIFVKNNDIEGECIVPEKMISSLEAQKD